MGLDQVAAQRGYHRSLYQALWDWQAASAAIERGQLRGMDLLGHFGTAGCDLVVAAIEQHRVGRPMRLVELGSGLGGVQRYVLSALAQRHVDVESAVGCELVVDHCVQAARIPGGPAWSPVATSVAALGLGSRTVDVVFATGSASHFTDMAATVREAHRILRPGGLLTFTEEVSLAGPAGEPSDEFRTLHPPDVFGTATPDDRRAQLAAAGFHRVELRDLSEWAADLLRKRLLALRVRRAAVAEVYGAEQTATIVATLTAAREEIVHGRLMPAQVVAIAGR